MFPGAHSRSRLSSEDVSVLLLPGVVCVGSSGEAAWLLSITERLSPDMKGILAKSGG